MTRYEAVASFVILDTRFRSANRFALIPSSSAITNTLSKKALIGTTSLWQCLTTSLAPSVEEGWDVVLCEPSDAVMFQSDYLDLLSSDAAERVAAETYGIMEYLDAKRPRQIGVCHVQDP